jgi:hypothetical protein
MDTALTNSLVQTSTALAQQQTASAVQVNVLKKALDSNANTAAQLLQSVQPAPALASSGTLGTQVNTYA